MVCKISGLLSPTCHVLCSAYVNFSACISFVFLYHDISDKVFRLDEASSYFCAHILKVRKHIFQVVLTTLKHRRGSQIRRITTKL